MAETSVRKEKERGLKTLDKREMLRTKKKV